MKRIMMNRENLSDRIAAWDNIKFCLMITVVVGHLANPYTKNSAFYRSIYLLIYSFHMPLYKSPTTSSTGGLILPLQRGIVTARPKGRCHKHYYWSAYKAVLLESSFLDSSACSLIYFCTASSVTLPIVST